MSDEMCTPCHVKEDELNRDADPGARPWIQILILLLAVFLEMP